MSSYAIIGGFMAVVIVGLTVALVLMSVNKKPAAPALSAAIPHNQRMAQQNMQNAVAQHRRLNAQAPVRLNTASVHTEAIPPVREQHNFNVRFGQSREPLRNMMASDNEGAHLSAAIWSRESLIRQHKVIS